MHLLLKQYVQQVGLRFLLVNTPVKNGCFANHTATRPTIESVTSKMKKLGYEFVLAGKSHVKPHIDYFIKRGAKAFKNDPFEKKNLINNTSLQSI